MKKLGLSLFSGIALVAFMGLSGTAVAAEKHDPDCDGHGPPTGPFEVFGFAIDTPSSHVTHAVADLTGAGLACGSSIRDGAAGVPGDHPGEESLNSRAVIDNPPGAQTNPTVGSGSPFAVGDYVGRAKLDSLSWVWTGRNSAVFIDHPIGANDTIIRVADPAGTDCETFATEELIACYKGVLAGPLVDGHGWVWVEDLNPDPLVQRTRTTIGPFHNDTDPSQPAGLTQIDDFDLCAYAGAGPTGESCGSSSTPNKWVQKNGDSGAGCLGHKGQYKVVVFNRRGWQTAPRSACVNWAYPASRANVTVGGPAAVDPKDEILP